MFQVLRAVHLHHSRMLGWHDRSPNCRLWPVRPSALKNTSDQILHNLKPSRWMIFLLLPLLPLLPMNIRYAKYHENIMKSWKVDTSSILWHAIWIVWIVWIACSPCSQPRDTCDMVRVANTWRFAIAALRRVEPWCVWGEFAPCNYVCNISIESIHGRYMAALTLLSRVTWEIRSQAHSEGMMDQQVKIVVQQILGQLLASSDS